MQEILIREAPSHNEITKDDVLRLIVAQVVRPIFSRPHLDRGNYWAFLAGFIGDRGGGKSASCAVVSVVDHMMAGKKVFANMNINIDIEVSDDIARYYGLNSGGIVHYQSEPLIKDALLDLDEKYRRCCLLIEEINIEYSNVRRFMSNTNIDFNQVVQQLRHLEVSLLYNVIDEMFIDPQLRTLTDTFIKTYDTAFNIDALSLRKPRGIDFQWTVYPMTGYIAGEQGKYSRTKRPLPPIYFHFEEWRGIYNTLRNQEKGIYTISTKEKNKRLMARWSIESRPDMTEALDESKFLRELALNLKQDGIKELTSAELIMKSGHPLSRLEKEWLSSYGVMWNSRRQKYMVNSFNLPGANIHAALKD